MLRLFLFGMVCVWALAVRAQWNEDEATSKIRAVQLRGLNKVTAQTETLKGTLGSVLRFGSLEVIAKSCWSAPPHERPEHAALMEIMELKADEPPERIFAGWMFASSPALNALEHPVYDITLVKCL